MRIYLWAILAMALITSCATPLIPSWQGTLYQGDPVVRAMVAPSHGLIVYPQDPAFGDLVAMSFEDFRAFWVTYVLGCRTWANDKIMIPKVETPPTPGK